MASSDSYEGSSDDTDDMAAEMESQILQAEDSQRKIGEEIALLSAVLHYCNMKGRYPFTNSDTSEDFASHYPDLQGTGEELMKKFLDFNREYKKQKKERGSGRLLKDPSRRIQFRLWTAIAKGVENPEDDPLAEYDFLRNSHLVNSLPKPFLQECLKLLPKSELKQLDVQWEKVTMGEMMATKLRNTAIEEQRTRLMEIIEANRSDSADDNDNDNSDDDNDNRGGGA